MSWVGLRYKCIEPLFPEEWNAVIDALDWLYAYFVDIRTRTLNKDALQSIDVDIIPAEDRKYDLGAPDRRWEQIYAYFGYFDGDLLVQGKRVLKDEDPVYIAAFIDQAKVSVDWIKSYLSQTAGNTAVTASNTGEIKNQLASISSKLDTVNSKLGDISDKVGDVIASLSEIAAGTDLLVDYARYIDVKLAAIKAKVESIEATSKSIDTTVKSIDERVVVVVATLSEIDGKLVSIRDYARSLPDIYAKIVEVSGKLDEANARLSESVATLSEIDAKVVSIRDYVRYMPDIYAKLVEANARLEEANTRLSDIHVSLSDIESTVATIESYARELPTIRARTESIDVKMDSVVTSLSEIDGKVASIESYARDMPTIRAKTESIDAKLDTTNARLGETVAILTEIDSKLASIKDYVKYVADETASIEVKTASIEVHVSSIDTKLDTTNTKLDNIEAKVASIDNKFDTQLSTRASEATLKKCCAFDYDFAIRRSGGRLLAMLDFTVNDTEFGVNEFDLGFIKVDGDVVSKSIVSWASEGIPQPEGTGSPYILKVTVAPRGLVYVRVPIKARYWKPFSAYITLYARGRDVRVLPYVTLGGILSGFRNKLPRRLRLPADRWGRFMIHWFMEAHHGCAELVIEVENPWDEQVDVYLGVITAGEVEPYVKGHMMLFGWEDTFELELNNEVLEFVTAIMLPTNAGEVASLTVEYGIAGDGSNPLSIAVDMLWGGVTIISDSNSSTTPKYSFFDFKIVNAKRGPYGFEYMPFRVRLSTSGSGKLVKFAIVLKAFAREYRYQRYVETMVPGGSLVTLIDYSGDVKHIVGGRIEATAPSDGDVNILADTPEGEVIVAKIPAGSTRTVDINGRYTYLKIQNTGSGTATVRATVAISDSYLPR